MTLPNPARATIAPKPTVQPEESPLFTRWHDPVSGVESLILRNAAAPFQQSFYFVNPSFTADARYLWFYAVHPPGGHHLGVADLVEQTVRYCPETLFLDASPYVDPVTGEVYWANGIEEWKPGPGPEDR